MSANQLPLIAAGGVAAAAAAFPQQVNSSTGEAEHTGSDDTGSDEDTARDTRLHGTLLRCVSFCCPQWLAKSCLGKCLPRDCGHLVIWACFLCALAYTWTTFSEMYDYIFYGIEGADALLMAWWGVIIWMVIKLVVFGTVSVGSVVLICTYGAHDAVRYGELRTQFLSILMQGFENFNLFTNVIQSNHQNYLANESMWMRSVVLEADTIVRKVATLNPETEENDAAAIMEELWMRIEDKIILSDMVFTPASVDEIRKVATLKEQKEQTRRSRINQRREEKKRIRKRMVATLKEQKEQTRMSRINQRREEKKRIR